MRLPEQPTAARIAAQTGRVMTTMIAQRIPMLLLLLAAAGCDSPGASGTSTATGAPTLAPTSSALAAPKPATTAAKKATIDKAGSKVEFLMEAPKEKIHGVVGEATTGELDVDLMDVTKSTGLVTVDIGDLAIYQAKIDDKGKIDEEKKVDKQNEHARTWLEISPDAPAEMRDKNRKVQFSIKSIKALGDKDVTKMTGKERKVMMTVTGDFLLHGHKAEKTAELEATFTFDGDKPVSVHVKTAKPFAVGLVEHDVKPRDAFGKLALKTLEALSPKVAKEALVTLDYTARFAN
jgi:hypothetical protein